MFVSCVLMRVSSVQRVVGVFAFSDSKLDAQSTPLERAPVNCVALSGVQNHHHVASLVGAACVLSGSFPAYDPDSIPWHL